VDNPPFDRKDYRQSAQKNPPDGKFAMCFRLIFRDLSLP
jgi:hypothetical protein